MLRDRFSMICDDREVRDYMRRRCGCVYGRPPSARVDLSSETMQPLLKRYCASMAAALADEAAGDAVVVYVDETFVHVGEYDDESWYPVDDDGVPTVTAIKGTGAGGGDLFIVLHAITRDGVLRTVGENGKPLPHLPEYSTDARPNAFYAFRATAEAEQDYHRALNRQFYMWWLEHCLRPAFCARYPGKAMRLVLDNCSVHRVRSSLLPESVSAMSRPQLLDALEAAGVTELPVTKRVPRSAAERLREQTIMAAGAVFGATRSVNDIRKPIGGCALRTDARSGGYNVHELRELLRSTLNDTGTYLELERVFAVWSTVDGVRHRVVWTVPYQSTTQPIELCWSIIKRFLRRTYTPGRTSAQLYAALYDAFYGTPDGRHNGLTAEICRSCIRHAHDAAAALMREHCEYTGTFEHPGALFGVDVDRVRAGRPLAPSSAPVQATTLMFDNDYTFGMLSPVLSAISDDPVSGAVGAADGEDIDNA